MFWYSQHECRIEVVNVYKQLQIHKSNERHSTDLTQVVRHPHERAKSYVFSGRLDALLVHLIHCQLNTPLVVARHHEAGCPTRTLAHQQLRGVMFLL